MVMKSRPCLRESQFAIPVSDNRYLPWDDLEIKSAVTKIEVIRSLCFRFGDF